MSRLLVVDDEEPLRLWAQRVLSENGFGCETAGDVAEARAALGGEEFELALLDINMPGESGLRLLAEIRSEHPDCAVVMVTGEDSVELATTAIEHGAYGYLIKPVLAGELLINVVNALNRRRQDIESRHLLMRLQATAVERADSLAQALEDLRVSRSDVRLSQAETILRLARLVEYRDEDTGRHLQRMSAYCEILARRSGIAPERSEAIRLASQLHDVGKVAIPDSVLLKPGKLTDEEMQTMRDHCQIGYEMLAGSSSDVVRLGATIARSHHEWWDGSGYPQGLAGEAIPLEGRIAAIADVYDALTTDRVYRPAFPHKIAVEMMRAERGSHFDPSLLDVFMSSMGELETVRGAFPS
jgi:putative two-component system response regulator